MMVFWPNMKETGAWIGDKDKAMLCMLMAPRTKVNSRVSSTMDKVRSSGCKVTNTKANLRKEWWRVAVNSLTLKVECKRAPSDVTTSSQAIVCSTHLKMPCSKKRQFKDWCLKFLSVRKRLNFHSRCNYSEFTRRKTFLKDCSLVFHKAECPCSLEHPGVSCQRSTYWNKSQIC